jgi:hypothetical protein
MAVQQITHKKIIKYDTDNPNFKNTPKPEKVVNGNVDEENIYGEKKHTYQPDNGNLQMNEMMTGIMNKLDGLSVNSDIVQKSRAVEVDIKREIAIGKLDTNAVKSEEYVGKVKTKKDKLKALRKRNGR